MRQSQTGSRKGDTAEADGEKRRPLCGKAKEEGVFQKVMERNMAISSKRTTKMVHFLIVFVCLFV